MIAAETRLKVVKDIRTVQSARLGSRDAKSKWLRRKYTFQTKPLSRARAASAQFQVSIADFTQSIRPAMDASVSELKDAMVAIVSEAF